MSSVFLFGFIVRSDFNEILTDVLKEYYSLKAFVAHAFPEVIKKNLVICLTHFALPVITCVSGVSNQ